ncbi:FAD-binding oxidoreductase [Bradyrhizobium sp. BRP14]|nr:FAD-binding oxidoreductase [Bradyrhizobium sp. BRP14]
MLSDDEHVTNLRSMLGEKGVLVGRDTAGYELGARFDKGLAAFVLRPASTAEVSTAVAYCVKNQIHIVAQGSNTGVVSGSTPDPSGQQAVLGHQ